MGTPESKADDRKAVRCGTACNSFLIFACAAFLGLAVYYYPFLHGDASFFLMDHSIYFEPLCRYIGSRFAEGQLPLWNPYIGCGQSQIAIVSPGIFYPPHVLFGLLAYSPCVAWQMIIDQLAAMVGIWFLIKHYGWGSTAAAAAAVTVGLSSYMFSLTDNFTIVSTAAWLPAAIYFSLLVHSSSANARVAGIAGCSVCTALMLLGGRPEIWLPGMFVLFVSAIASLDRKAFSGQSCRKFLLGLLPLAVGILLAAPSLLPVAQWTFLSPRTVQSQANSLLWSASWYDFLSIVVPQPYFDPAAISAFDSLARPFLNPFLGPLAISLAVIGICDRSFRRRWLMLLLAAVTIVLVAGNNLPVMPLLCKAIPVLTFMRYPIKLVFFLNLATAICAARGARYLLSEPEGSAKAVIWIAAFWLSSSVVGALMMSWSDWGWLGLHDFLNGYVGNLAGQALAAIGRSVAVWSLVALISALLLIGYCTTNRQRPHSAHAFSIAFGLLMIGSMLFAAVKDTRFAAEPSFYRHPSFVADMLHRLRPNSIVPPRIVHIDQKASMIPVSYYARGKERDPESVRQLQRQWCKYNVGDDYGISSLYPYEGAITAPDAVIRDTIARRATIWPDRGSSSQTAAYPAAQEILARVCRMSACDFVFCELYSPKNEVSPPLNPALFKVVVENPYLDTRIEEVRQPLPFAYFISNWRWMPSADQSLRFILSASPQTFDPAHCVLLSGARSTAPSSLGSPSGPSAEPVAISPEAYAPERIELRVNAPRQGIVVVNDSFYPGWHATVDGKAAEIYCANSLFRAVAVPPGSHRIAFTFSPGVLTCAYLLSLIGVLLMCLGIAGVRKKEPTPLA